MEPVQIQTLGFANFLAQTDTVGKTVLALLLITTGIQVIVLGLLGELLIYLHSRDQMQYRVSERIGAARDDKP